MRESKSKCIKLHQRRTTIIKYLEVNLPRNISLREHKSRFIMRKEMTNGLPTFRSKDKWSRNKMLSNTNLTKLLSKANKKMPKVKEKRVVILSIKNLTKNN